jgi:hypothetical protein
MYQRALEGKEKALGRDHISTIQTINNLGSLFRRPGRLVCCASVLLHARSYFLHSVYSVLKLSLDLVKGLRSLLCSSLGFSLYNSKGIADCA